MMFISVFLQNEDLTLGFRTYIYSRNSSHNRKVHKYQHICSGIAKAGI